MDKMAVGRNIRRILDERKLSQVWLAEQIGSKNTIFTPWMNGKNLPSLITLYRISKVLNVTIDSLLEGIDEVSAEYSDDKKRIRQACLELTVIGASDVVTKKGEKQ